MSKIIQPFHFSIHPFPVSVGYFVLTTHSKTCCCSSTNSTRTEILNSIGMKPVGNFLSPNWIWILGWTQSWWWSFQKIHFILWWLKKLVSKAEEIWHFFGILVVHSTRTEIWNFIGMKPLAEILTSNSVGTKLSFPGCNQDNNHGSNFIIKNKICLVLQEKEISNHRN